MNEVCGRFRRKVTSRSPFGGHFFEVAVPGFARVDAELLGRRSGNQVPGAFDVPGGERLAVMPFDARPQFEGQLLAVLAPRPARSEVGDDRVQAVLRHVLVEHDQIVEHAHHRTDVWRSSIPRGSTCSPGWCPMESAGRHPIFPLEAGAAARSASRRQRCAKTWIHFCLPLACWRRPLNYLSSQTSSMR